MTAAAGRCVKKLWIAHVENELNHRAAMHAPYAPVPTHRTRQYLRTVRASTHAPYAPVPQYQSVPHWLHDSRIKRLRQPCPSSFPRAAQHGHAWGLSLRNCRRTFSLGPTRLVKKGRKRLN
jgi:hypothetical protein